MYEIGLNIFIYDDNYIKVWNQSLANLFINIKIVTYNKSRKTIKFFIIQLVGIFMYDYECVAYLFINDFFLSFNWFIHLGVNYIVSINMFYSYMIKKHYD